MITTVLLVDDEQAFVATMSKRLTKRGLTVHTANSGPEALDLLARRDDIDVVVLDVKMPGMDGIEVLGAIKAGYPLVEVVMLTGHGTIEDAIEGMKRGARDYLTKPCDLDVLMAKISESKDRRRRQQQRIVEAEMQEIARRRGY